MANDWRDLTELTGGRGFVVERVRLKDSDVAIEGAFEPSPLAMLPIEDQVFVAAFVRCHGSIKQMEKLFGVSYPTIKNRLNRLGERFGFIEVDAGNQTSGEGVLDRLERGEITVEQAEEMLRR
ncbi:MAG: DUF2089 domain-containing protein [Phycisphaerae bacterium]